MIHMKVKPFLLVNHNVRFLFIVVFVNESRETAREMYLPLCALEGGKEGMSELRISISVPII